MTTTSPSDDTAGDDVLRFLRGCVFPGVPGTPYPRFDPLDVARIPGDTWDTAQTPAGVRLEFTAEADAVEIDYVTNATSPGYRGDAGGVTFDLWRGGKRVDEQRAELGRHQVRLSLHGGGGPEERVTVYLPEGLRPEILSLSAVGGTIAPAPAQPRWLAYGDSITEGWSASGPSLSWPMHVARTYGLHAVNLGYAGSARGEIPCAEAMAKVPADVISLAYGTNCWSRTVHSTAMVEAGFDAFVTVLRAGHPETPIVVISPFIRPEAEQTTNALGSTLSAMRHAMEGVVADRRSRGDAHLHLVPGLAVIETDDLVDGVHPGDRGHERAAGVIGPVLRAALDPS